MEFVIDRDKLEVRMSREFNAPRQRLWQAHTDADQVAKWWGPAKYTTTIDKMEVRPGGAWRFVQKDQQGQEFGFHGEFKQLIEPDHITWTFVFEGMPDADSHAVTETVNFIELPGGKTKLSTVSHYKTLEDLEGMAASGMEQGARETWDRLAAHVQNI